MWPSVAALWLENRFHIPCHIPFHSTFHVPLHVLIKHTFTPHSQAPPFDRDVQQSVKVYLTTIAAVTVELLHVVIFGMCQHWFLTLTNYTQWIIGRYLLHVCVEWLNNELSQDYSLLAQDWWSLIPKLHTPDFPVNSWGGTWECGHVQV